MNPDQIPDLHWQLVNTYHTTNIGQLEIQASDISTHGVDVDTISHAEGNKYKNWCGTTLNTDTSTSQSNQEPTIHSVLPINKHGI